MLGFREGEALEEVLRFILVRKITLQHHRCSSSIGLCPVDVRVHETAILGQVLAWSLLFPKS
jgi:hypothetical protein